MAAGGHMAVGLGSWGSISSRVIDTRNKAKQEARAGCTSSRMALNDPLPPIRLHHLKVPQHLRRVSLAGAKCSKT